MLVPVEPREFVGGPTNIGGSPADPMAVPMPSLGAIAGAAVRQGNLIGSFMARQDLGANEIDPEFDFLEGVKGTKYEQYADRFAAETFNRHQQAALMRQVDMEEEDRATLRAAGWVGFTAELGAGLFSPENLVPFGGQVYRGVRTLQTAGRFAKELATVGALSAGVSELGLQSSQEIRPASESVFAIGGGAVLGGIFGAGIGAVIGRKDMALYARALGEHMNSRTPDQQMLNEAAMRDFISGGAAAVRKESIDDLTVAGAAAKFTADKTAQLNPGLRALSSPSIAWRRISGGMMENPLYLKKNFADGASEAAVETLTKEYTQGRLSVAMEQAQEAYRAYRAAGGELKRDQFNIQVGKAMRRTDRSDDPHIQKAAEIWRRQVFDPLKDQAIEVGLLPKDVHVETAASYLSRVYNRPKIEANEGAFKAIVRSWIGGELKKVEFAAARAGEEPRLPDFVSEADRQAYIAEIADHVYNSVTGRLADGDIPRDIVASKRGPLKERTFNIPDALIEDYLESDVEAVGRRYARLMAADVELQRKFGSTTLEPQIREVREDYQRLRDAVAADPALSEAQKGKALAKLISREKSDINDLKAVRDMLRGAYLARENATNYARVANAANTVNYLRLMGGVTVSSLTDIGRHPMVHGLANVMRDGIGPLATNLRSVKMAVAEAKLAGAVAERILNTRMATWAELTDPYSHASPFERFLQNTARGFSKANGMVYWNDFQKSFASVLTQARILRGSVDFSRINQRERAYLAFLGIDEDMAGRIARQFDEHGSIEPGGVRVAHTPDWSDELAVRTYRAAINKDVDSTIVTKGIGDIPLFMHTPTGRTLTQFKSFAVASHQRAFIRGMQEAPAGMLSGVIVSTIVGMMIYFLKSVEANRTEDISDNPGRWIAEGLDRSGLFAIAFEANNTVEKFLNVGAYKALESIFPDAQQGGKASRYLVKSPSGTILGPTGDFIDGLVKVASAARKGDLTESDVNAIRRLAPFATLPGIRSLSEYMIMPAARQAVAN